jgi:hypothetical protein
MLAEIHLVSRVAVSTHQDPPGEINSPLASVPNETLSFSLTSLVMVHLAANDLRLCFAGVRF